MTDYTGEDWPYEAHTEQKAKTAEGEVYVLLLGERQDVDAIREITLSYPYLRRYGRPFAPLYNLVMVRPDTHYLFALQETFKHQQYSLHPARLDLLRSMLEQCPTLLYEIVYQQDGTITTERNFEYEVQGSLNASAEAALAARGWKPRGKANKKLAQGLLPVAEHVAAKKARREGKPVVTHTFDRWWHELYHFWRGKRKS